MNLAPRAVLLKLLDAGIAAVHPQACLPACLPPPPSKGRLVVLAAGKAAAAMASVAEKHYLDDLGFARAHFAGSVVTRSGYGLPLSALELIEAGHPLPDEHSMRASETALALAKSAGEHDLVLILLSGGGSALWTAPAHGVTLMAKQALTAALLRCGAPIHEINCVRKHLSRIKGGRLARAALPARIAVLAISDVAGDDPSTIASGPSVADGTSLDDARRILRVHDLTITPEIAAALNDPGNETPGPNDLAFAHVQFEIIANCADALDAAAGAARALGLRPVILDAAMQGEARALAAGHVKPIMQALQESKPAILLSGGEAAVTVTGAGAGGPNQEFALALAIALHGRAGVHALAADTDGTDGGSGRPSDPAGAIIAPDTLARAAQVGLNPRKFLDNNDSTAFFTALGDIVAPGPTYTNVNDFRAILVNPIA